MIFPKAILLPIINSACLNCWRDVDR